mgnify:CR=1 FL=1
MEEKQNGSPQRESLAAVCPILLEGWNMKYCVGIDLGGTNIAVGVVDKQARQIVTRAKRKTNAHRPWQEIAEDMIAAAKEAVEELGCGWEQIESIGIGSPGMVDVEKREIVFAGNLPFQHTPLAAYIEERVSCPVFLENDANAAAYGEFAAGAGRGTKSMVAITLGTGVGSGIIIDCKIYSGYGFAAGEIGHNVLVVNGRQCSCGRKGCFEAYASATGLICTTREYMEQHRNSLMWEEAEQSIDKVSGRTAFNAMRRGDPWAKAVVEEYTAYLAEGIVNVVNALQPEVVCLGGGISKEGDNLLAPINQYIEKYAFARFADRKTKVVIAQLGNDAGILGAALLGLQEE